MKLSLWRSVLPLAHSTSLVRVEDFSIAGHSGVASHGCYYAAIPAMENHRTESTRQELDDTH